MTRSRGVSGRRENRREIPADRDDVPAKSQVEKELSQTALDKQFEELFYLLFLRKGSAPESGALPSVFLCVSHFFKTWKIDQSSGNRTSSLGLARSASSRVWHSAVP